MRGTRRQWLSGLATAASGLVLAACDQLTLNPSVQKGLARAEGLTRRAQRLLVDRTALAQEFPESRISPDFRANGSIGAFMASGSPRRVGAGARAISDPSAANGQP